MTRMTRMIHTTMHGDGQRESEDQHQRERLRGMGTVRDAVRVIALHVLSLLALAGCAASPSAQGRTSTGTTATLRPASAWTTTTFNGSSTGGLQPTVAPSDPRVIYLSARDQNGPMVQRSDDDGKTWRKLPVPTTDLAADPSGKNDLLDVTPSPTDANTVLVTLRSFLDNPRCPTAASSPTGGGVSDAACFFQYLSHDGGTTWTPVTLPAPSSVIGEAPLTSALVRIPSSGTLVAQGSRLYAALGPNPDTTPTAGWRLVTSSDGGRTWVYADQTLVAQGVHLTSDLPDASGSGAWALAVPAGSTPNPDTVQLWRTDDGATWHQAKLPLDCGSNCALVGSTALGGGGSRLVVSDQQADPQTFQFEVTTDDGAHWQVLPSTGVPSTLEAEGGGVSAESAGVLSDGTILALFVAPSMQGAARVASQSGYYAWAPGAHSWQRVTPAPPSYLYTSWLTVQSGGGYTVWVLGPATGGGHADLQTLQLVVASANLG
jgi:BNR/Asp-box repeat